MKKYFFISCLAVLLSGCCSTVPQTEYFDISTPPAHANYNYQLKVIIETNSLLGEKMIFTKEPHSVFFDGYNRWAQTPNQMLTLYFYLYFNNLAAPTVDKTFPVQLEVNIIKFECNLTKKESLLYAVVFATNTKYGKLLFKKSYAEKFPMKELTASSFASSMADAVNSLAGKINNQLEKIYKKKHSG